MDFTEEELLLLEEALGILRAASWGEGRRRVLSLPEGPESQNYVTEMQNQFRQIEALRARIQAALPGKFRQ